MLCIHYIYNFTANYINSRSFNREGSILYKEIKLYHDNQLCKEILLNKIKFWEL